MAELAKKLHFKKNGIEQTAKAYSTVDETGGKYAKLKIDNVFCYVPLGATDDATATIGRAKYGARYYKYADVLWEQPILTSNGTMGGDSFACDQSNYYESANEPAQLAFYVFNGTNDNEWQCNGVNTNSWYWISWYSPDPIKISQIIVTNAEANYVVKDWILQGCNDNSSWVDLASGVNTNTSMDGNWVISVSENNRKSFKYHRIYCKPNSSTAIMIDELTITATISSVIEVSSDEPYDYVVGGDDTTYAIKSQSTPPYAVVSYTTVGTHTFTVPANVTRLRVAVCGGGGGGAAATFASSNSSFTGKTGGTSSVGSLSATGGAGGTVGCGEVPDDSYIPQGMYANTGKNGTPIGRNDGNGFALSFSIGVGTYGQCGGSAANNGGGGTYGRTAYGGSGGYNSNYLTVTPGQTLTVIVGSGGNGTSYRDGKASAGTSGFALIAYGGDI